MLGSGFGFQRPAEQLKHGARAEWHSSARSGPAEPHPAHTSFTTRLTLTGHRARCGPVLSAPGPSQIKHKKKCNADVLSVRKQNNSRSQCSQPHTRWEQPPVWLHFDLIKTAIPKKKFVKHANSIRRRFHFFQQTQDSTISGDAKLNISMLQACPVRFLLITIPFPPNHIDTFSLHRFLRYPPSLVSPCSLVPFSCRSGLNNRGGVCGVHAAGGTSTQNYTHKDENKYRDSCVQKTNTNTNTETRARKKKKCKHEHRDARSPTNKNN